MSFCNLWRNPHYIRVILALLHLKDNRKQRILRFLRLFCYFEVNIREAWPALPFKSGDLPKVGKL